MNQPKNAIEILEQDETAKKLSQRFNKIAEEQGLTGKAYDDARSALIGLLIRNNPEAMDATREEVYQHFKEQEQQ